MQELIYSYLQFQMLKKQRNQNVAEVLEYVSVKTLYLHTFMQIHILESTI